MGLLQNWGFSANSWQGQRGEYWVLLQIILILGFVALPVYRFSPLPQPPVVYWLWAGTAGFASLAILFFFKGLLDLGHNLTPLPHPRTDGSLVQTGIYSVVRHPLYSGVILAAIAFTLYQWSLSHLIGVGILLVFLDAKARQEEHWLTQKHPEYVEYRQQVKKLIPWIY